jgi:hypothetical protein
VQLGSLWLDKQQLVFDDDIVNHHRCTSYDA